MSYYLKVQVYGMEQYVEGRTQGFRVRFKVIEAVGLDANIFVYQIKTAPGYTHTDYFFQNVASPADLEEYPAGEPADLNASDLQPFFRLDEADLVFRSAQAVDEAIEKLEQELTGLIESLQYMDTLAPTQVIEIGTPPSSSSSSSSDSSSSSSEA
jgi:hypothetical protein